MAEPVKRQYDLAVLKLYLDRSDPENFPAGQAVFEFERAEVPILRRAVGAQSLGLPATLQELRRRRYHYSEPAFELPGNIGAALAAHLEPPQPLWLELAQPYGHLPLLPWERLLQPQLERPILRLPYFSLQPITIPDSFELVLCASAPEAKMPIPLYELIERITQIVLGALQAYTVIHIFTDVEFYNLLQDPLGGVPTSPAEGQVILYNPQEAADFTPPERSPSISETPGHLDNPWLRWISQALAGRSVDAVHFVCHGYLAPDQGGLAFAETPARNVDRAWARFVGVQQLSTFLNQVGAGAILVTSPEPNFSRAGLRLLIDQLARLRPGVALLHEARDDDAEMTALTGAYRFMFDRAWAISPPISPALSLYCHPSQVSMQYELEALISSAFKPMTTQYRALRGETAPPLTQALQAALAEKNEWAQATALAGLAPYLASEQLNQVFRTAMKIKSEWPRVGALVGLAPFLTEAQRTEAVQAAVTVESMSERARALAGLAPYLSRAQLTQALQAAMDIEDILYQVEALAGLAPYLTGQQLDPIFQTMLGIKNELVRAKGIAALAPYLAATGYPQQALPAVLALKSESFKADALSGIAPYLAQEQIADVLQSALAIGSDTARIRALTGLAPHLSEAQLTAVLQAVLAVEDETTRAEGLAGLGPYLAGPEWELAFQAARSLGDEAARARALTGLALTVLDALLPEIYDAVLTIENELVRVRAMADLVEHPWARGLGGEILGDAFRIAIVIQNEWERAEALAALAPYLGNTAFLEQALRAALAIEYEENRAKVLAALLPHLTGEQLDRVWEAALAIHNQQAQADVLTALAPHLSRERLTQALQTILGISSEVSRANALAGLAPALTEESQQSTPAWVAASLRFIEQSAAQYLEQPPVSETHTARRKGVEEALSYLSDVVSRHVVAAKLENRGQDSTTDHPPGG